jgi:hypothetical protein
LPADEAADDRPLGAGGCGYVPWLGMVVGAVRPRVVAACGIPGQAVPGMLGRELSLGHEMPTVPGRAIVARRANRGQDNDPHGHGGGHQAV